MKILILFTFFTLSATGVFASECADLWSDVKVTQVLDDLAAMRMNLDLKMVEDPNSLVYGQLDLEFKMKEAEFIKTLGINKTELKERITGKIKALQQSRDLEVKKQKVKESLVKEQTQAIHSNIQGLLLEEVQHSQLGTLLRIKKDGVPLKVQWAKLGLEGKSDNGKGAVDLTNRSLVHPDSEARKRCLDLGGDLPTEEEWEELWEAVDKDLEKLEAIMPGIKRKHWWSSSVQTEYSGFATMFNGHNGNTDWFTRSDNEFYVRCVLR